MEYQYLLLVHFIGFAVFVLAHGASSFVTAALGGNAIRRASGRCLTCPISACRRPMWVCSC
jgi:hypothetical protein